MTLDEETIEQLAEHLENADQVIVLDHGRVIESGTHAQLLERGGVYAKLQQAQLGGEAGAGPSGPAA